MYCVCWMQAAVATACVDNSHQLLLLYGQWVLGALACSELESTNQRTQCLWLCPQCLWL